jgi:hypothetical protein
MLQVYLNKLIQVKIKLYPNTQKMWCQYEFPLSGSGIKGHGCQEFFS